jgi:hypothetical protein
MKAGSAMPRASRISAGSVACAILVALSSLLCGCSARRAAVEVVPRESTGVAGGEGVAIVLHEYRACSEWAKEACAARSHPLVKERQIEGCIEWGMRRVDRELRIVPGARFRQVAFPRVAYRDLPRSPEEILSLLVSADFQERITPLRIRYLIVVGVHIEKYGSEVKGEGGSEGGAIGSEWKKDTQMSAVILDVMNAHEAGTLAAKAEGKGVIVFPFLFGFPLPVVLPLPPVGWSSPTTSRACSALGEASARFIVGGDPPED